MGRVAEFDADVKRVTRTLEALGEDSLRDDFQARCVGASMANTMRHKHRVLSQPKAGIWPMIAIAMIGCGSAGAFIMYQVMR